MGKQAYKDLFSNIAYATVTESAADTLTFAEIQTGVAVHQKVAWVINRILWYLTPASQALVTAAADSLSMALVLNNKVDDLADLSDPAIVDVLTLMTVLFGTAASGERLFAPILRDFSGLPGGGLIITPKPLYIAAKGVSLGVPSTCSCRIFYTIKELAADEFWELVQASRIVQ